MIKKLRYLLLQLLTLFRYSQRLLSSRFALMIILGLLICTELQVKYVNAMPEPFNPPKPEINVSATGDEKTYLNEVVDTVNKLFASQKLWRNFDVVAAQYPNIFIGPEYHQKGLPVGMADSAGAVSILWNSLGQYHIFQSILELTGTYYSAGNYYTGICVNNEKDKIKCRATEFDQNYSNNLVATHGIGTYLPNNHEVVSIDIGREVFKRYNSKSDIEKSCTYNTLAHEWTHTIGKNQNDHWSIIVDSGSNIPSKTVKLPYLFGSVAQCTWLQNNGKIGQNDSDLKDCVTKFGVDQFFSLKCK